MQATVYNTKGAEAGKVTLPESVFGQKWNANLVHEVVVSMQSNARQGNAHTKDRSEVSGGGKKPWRQKGTGRARHGSRRSPIWRGGGVTFGPRSEKDYGKKINRNVRAKALAVVLSRKLEDGEIIFVDQFAFDAPKTAEALGIIKALGGIKGAEALAGKKKNAAFIVLPSRNENTEKSFRNFGNMLVGQAKDLNPVSLLTYKYIVIAGPEAAVEALEARIAPKKKVAPKTEKVAEKKVVKKASAKKPVVKKVAAKKPAAKKPAVKKTTKTKK